MARNMFVLAIRAVFETTGPKTQTLEKNSFFDKFSSDRLYSDPTSETFCLVLHLFRAHKQNSSHLSTEILFKKHPKI